MGYWDGTNEYLRSHGGQGPACPSCGKRMFPADDHGRFSCFCNNGEFDAISGRQVRRLPPIPQVDASVMSDA